MAEFCFQIAGADYVASYTARVTYEGAPARMPDMHSPGEPPDPPEIELSVTGLRMDLGAFVDLPRWLEDQIEDAIRQDSDAVEAILKNHRERKEADADDAADNRRRELRDEAHHWDSFYSMIDD